MALFYFGGGAPRLQVEEVRHMKWTHNWSQLSLQFIAKYASMVNDMIKICPNVMYMHVVFAQQKCVGNMHGYAIFAVLHMH